jgi:hypothetical protein
MFNTENLKEKITKIVDEWDDFNEEHEIHDWQSMKRVLIQQLTEGLK